MIPIERPAGEMDIEKIQSLLPHRYPFLLVDRVLEILPGPDPKARQGRKIRALKNVTANEPFFEGHFPNWKIMPGVLQVEALAQAAALASILPTDSKFDVAIVSITNAKFRRPVVPGDQLILTAEILKERGPMISVGATAFVEDQKVAEMELMARVFV